MNEEKKVRIGYEVDQEAKNSPFMQLIGDRVKTGILGEVQAAEFYRIGWTLCMEKVAKRHNIDDIELVREAFEYYNDS